MTQNAGFGAAGTGDYAADIVAIDADGRGGALGVEPDDKRRQDRGCEQRFEG